MFHKKIRWYSILLTFNSNSEFYGLKYVYSVISVFTTSQNKKSGIDPFVDGRRFENGSVETNVHIDCICGIQFTKRDNDIECCLLENQREDQ